MLNCYFGLGGLLSPSAVLSFYNMLYTIDNNFSYHFTEILISLCSYPPVTLVSDFLVLFPVLFKKYINPCKFSPQLYALQFHLKVLCHLSFTPAHIFISLFQTFSIFSPHVRKKQNAFICSFHLSFSANLYNLHLPQLIIRVNGSLITTRLILFLSPQHFAS